MLLAVVHLIKYCDGPEQNKNNKEKEEDQKYQLPKMSNDVIVWSGIRRRSRDEKKSKPLHTFLYKDFQYMIKI